MRCPHPLLVLLLAFLPACGDGSDAARKVHRVAVIPKGTSHEFWKAVAKGARRADAELADLEIVWKGPGDGGAVELRMGSDERVVAEGSVGC